MRSRSAALALSVLVLAAPAAAQFFVDVTDEAQLSGTTAFRLSIGDVNNDGYPDIFRHRPTNAAGGDVLDKNYLLLNLPDPLDSARRIFVDVTDSSGIRANRDGTQDGRHSDGAIFADVDNDGDLDIFNTVYVHREYSMQTDHNDLLLNDGDGNFTLAPNSPFHTAPLYNTAAAVWTDYDRDGNIDLYIGNWYFNDLMSLDRLYKGNGDGSFTDVTASSGISAASTAVYGIASFDADDDGWMDLFAASYSHTASGAASRHWRNNGDGTFTQVQSSSGYNAYSGFGTGRASFGTMPRDFDNDGDEDFFEIWTHGRGDGDSGIHSTVVFNQGDGSFVFDFAAVDGRGNEDPDLSHHGDHYATWLDFDNDGLSDFALTESGYGNNRFYLFKQQPDHTFTAYTGAAGLAFVNLGDPPVHNVMALDYDRDGDEDLLIGVGNDSTSVQLWDNTMGNQNAWLQVTLVGGGGPGYANRSAIGAKVEVEAGGITQTRTVYAGNGHQCPQGPLFLHFGLGQATNVDRLTVHWPNQDQTSVTFNDLPVDSQLAIHEVCSPADKRQLLAVKQGGDVRLSWNRDLTADWWYGVYRDLTPDASQWGAALAPQVPGSSYLDQGALAAPDSYYYQVTTTNDCGETPLD